jgi:hypothetical protein
MKGQITNSVSGWKQIITCENDYPLGVTVIDIETHGPFAGSQQIALSPGQMWELFQPLLNYPPKSPNKVHMIKDLRKAAQAWGNLSLKDAKTMADILIQAGWTRNG